MVDLDRDIVVTILCNQAAIMSVLASLGEDKLPKGVFENLGYMVDKTVQRANALVESVPEDEDTVHKG